MSGESGSFRLGGKRFGTTHWSLIVAAGDSQSPDRRAALEALCRAYWSPVYAYVRRRGYDPSEAQDLTQGFFAHLLEGHRLKRADRERGRFRSFLLASVKNYLSNEWDRATAAKRGGGEPTLPLDFDGAEYQYRLEPSAGENPERLFERRWALTLLERVLGHLREELERSGSRERTERLLPFLIGDADIPYRQVAADLGMSESAVKVAVHRMRKRYGALLREEVREIVDSPDDVDREIRHLFEAVGSR